MLKKSLIALAIASTAFNASATLTIAAGGSHADGQQLISMEGASNSTTVALDDITATLSDVTAAYASSAKIRVTLTGGTLTPATAVTALWEAADLVSTGSVAYPSGNVVEITLGGTGATAVQGAVDTDVLTLGGLDVTATSFAKGAKITYLIEVLSSVGGAVIDSKSGTISEVVEQFGAKIGAAGDFGTTKIDVGKDRLEFVGGGLTETIGVDVTSALIDHLAADATTYAPKYVLNGSFGFLGSDAAKIVTDDDVESATGTPVVSDDFTMITEEAAALGATFDGTAADTNTETFTITVDGKTQVLAPQTFSVDVSFNYDDDESKKGTFSQNVAGGKWELNGDSAYIPYLPFGTAFAQSVTITNEGSVEGAISVDVIANGTTYTHALTATAKAKAVTDITAGVKAAVAAAGVTSGNVALNIVTNSPSGDVTVSALYYSKSDKDRGIVAVDNQL
ncbi:hypothetical protein QX776_12085 [Alteromonadaceae bacterium BrNp21-10]|nr:hypothetical protein [Alteromonadaceae bacterium BrNp21-10]